MAGPVDKSPTAYRTISEVATLIGVPQHVLRFWETRFPTIQPLKRGGNRRYYRPADVDLLQTINRLLYTEGYTIKGVQKLLDGGLLSAVADDAVPVDLPVQPWPTVSRSEPPRSLVAIRDNLARALDAARAL